MYICSECGFESSRWLGKCDKCEAWNSFEKVETFSVKSKKKGVNSKLKVSTFSQVSEKSSDRMKTGIGEFDLVLGGGFVPGSVVLLVGDPGIGKSTLVLHVLDGLKKSSRKLLYISGEESGDQVALRARRLGISEDISFVSTTDVDVISNEIRKGSYDLVIVDSIQTLATEDINGSAGSVSQVRESSLRLIDVAKNTSTAVVVIGHVTKGGVLAGPKVLEHLVDVVLYLEGDRYHDLRMLRGIKNRFGSTNETGVFEMGDVGLIEVSEPSKLFLSERSTTASGSIVASIVEGNRAFLLEVQALVSTSPFGYPKRTSSGFDQKRLELLIAVLTKRAGVALDNQDVYVNVVGGFKISEPASDLAVCLAIASSYYDKPAKGKIVAFGEVGLSGEVRSVSAGDKRIREAEKLGFSEVIIPKTMDLDFSGKLSSVSHVAEAVKRFS